MKAKRFFSLFLALALCLSMFPVSADGGVTEYNLWIGGTRVTSDNASDVLGDGTVSYDASENTLTLNGANIAKSIIETSSDASGHNCGVYYGGQELLKVNLRGDSSITSTTNTEGYAVCYGFYSNAGTTFSGDGSLTVTVGDYSTSQKECFGIKVKGNSKIEVGVSVSAKACSSKNNTSIGFYNEEGVLTVEGRLTAKGGEAEISTGIRATAGMIVNEGADVIAESDCGRSSIGLYCDSKIDVDCLTVNGGSVKARSKNDKENCNVSCGIWGSSVSDGYGILINGGNVTAEGGRAMGSDNSHISYGIRGCKIDILGGIVQTTGGLALRYSGSPEYVTASYGIYTTQNMFVGGDAAVTVRSGKVSSRCSSNCISDGIGIYDTGQTSTLTIRGNAKVRAEASSTECYDATAKRRAIFAPNVVIDENASVNARTLDLENSTVPLSFGIQCGNLDENNITISGGIVTAVGYSQALSKAPILSEGVTAGGGEDVDGSDAGVYDASDYKYYKWFRSPFDAPIIYAISLSPDSCNFEELSVGYSAPTKTFYVRNLGTVETGKLNLSVEGDHATSFTCSPSSIENIESGEIATFTVAPVTGLGEGTYNAVVNITGDHNIQEIIEVNLRVNPADDTGNPGDTGGSGDLGDTGGSGDTGVPGDTGETGYIGGSVDADDTAGSEGTDGTDAFFTPIVEEVQKAEIGDNKNQEKIDVKTDKKKGTALVELKDTKGLSGKDIYVRIPKIKDVTTNILSVPVEKLSQKAHEGSITFETYLADIVLPSNMLTEAKNVKRNNAEISVAEIKKADLPIDVQKRIGNKPLVSFHLSIDRVPFRWNNKAAAVRVSIPYTPSEKELKNLDGITAYYVDDGGKLVEMEDARYEAKTKAVVFTTTHFSYYVVGYNENKGNQDKGNQVEAQELTFSDVNPGDWYYDAVKYIASKKITNGTGNGKFSPKEPLSRAQFIVMLMRSFGIEPDASNTDNFSDVGDAYYTNYLAAAKRLGIAKGVGNNKFAPETAISREAMFTLLYNTLKVLDKLPTVDSGKTLSDFDDGAEVSGWAKEAVEELIKNGTVAGFNNQLRPADGSNRAEMAQLLYKLLSSD